MTQSLSNDSVTHGRLSDRITLFRRFTRLAVLDGQTVNVEKGAHLANHSHAINHVNNTGCNRHGGGTRRHQGHQPRRHIEQQPRGTGRARDVGNNDARHAQTHWKAQEKDKGHVGERTCTQHGHESPGKEDEHGDDLEEQRALRWLLAGNVGDAGGDGQRSPHKVASVDELLGGGREKGQAGAPEPGRAVQSTAH